MQQWNVPAHGRQAGRVLASRLAEPIREAARGARRHPEGAALLCAAKRLSPTAEIGADYGSFLACLIVAGRPGCKPGGDPRSYANKRPTPIQEASHGKTPRSRQAARLSLEEYPDPAARRIASGKAGRRKKTRPHPLRGLGVEGFGYRFLASPFVSPFFLHLF